jgi:C4-dicarboxylate transporter DctM subunit
MDRQRQKHPSTRLFCAFLTLLLCLLVSSLVVPTTAFAQDGAAGTGEVKTLEQMMGEVEEEGSVDAPPSEEADGDQQDDKNQQDGVKTLEEMMGEVEAEGGVEARDVADVETQDGDPEQANAPPSSLEDAPSEGESPEDEDEGMSIWFYLGIFGLIFGMILAGAPLYVLIGSLTMYLLFFGGIFDDFMLLTSIIEQTRGLADQTVLLAIPFFVISGAIMTEGDIAKRLIDVAEAVFGKLPGGMAISAVFACAFFAAISGSSPVTVIAIGSIMYPALLEKGYSSKFSMGLVTSAGSLGILIPPSIPMIVYAIVDPTGLKDPIGYSLGSTGGGDASVKDLFIAGLGPGLLIAGIMGVFALYIGMRDKVETTDFDPKKLLRAMQDGVWALILPVLILGGIYSGIFTPTQAAAVAVVYALVVEFFIHRSLGLEDVPRIFSESAVLMGSLLIIMALALGFNLYLDRAKIPEAAVELILDMELSIITFLLIVNVLLLIVGFFMDILSAILILVPLLAPIAYGLGIHPLHMAIIFIVNLEIGYLTPPIGLNLFVAGTLFKKGLGAVVKSVLPFMLLMLGALMLITYVPTISLGLVSWSKGGDFWVDFPDDRPAAIEADEEPGAAAPSGDDTDKAGEKDEPEEQPEGVKTLEEMMGEVEDEGGVDGSASDGEEDEGGVKTLEQMMDEVEDEGALDEPSSE